MKTTLLACVGPTSMPMSICPGVSQASSDKELEVIKKRSCISTLTVAPVLLTAARTRKAAPTPRQPPSIIRHYDSVENSVQVHDPLLAGTVRSAVSVRHDAALTCSDMARLNSINIQVGEVQSLAGLEFAWRLRSIILPQGGIRDLEPLRATNRLQQLVLRDHAVNDLSPLAELRVLRQINLSGNDIESLDPLQEMALLEALQVDRNAIRDLSPLGELTNLKVLRASHNQIEDASPLAGLTRLEEVQLAHNVLQDIDFVSHLQLNLLDVSHNQIRVVAPLAQSLGLSEEVRFDLRHNCLDFAADYPFLLDPRYLPVTVFWKPQMDCGTEAMR